MTHRNELIAPRPSPSTAKGISGKLADMRKRGPFHALLSALSYAVLVAMVWVMLRWAISPTWSAASVAECRDILGDIHGKACWGVIRERWVQLLVGFYPRDLIWRPAVAFVLFGLSVAALLSPRVTEQLRKFGVLAFVACPYLLWGGSIASWVIAAIAFALIMLAMKYTQGRSIFQRLLVVLLIGTLGLLAVQNIQTFGSLQDYGLEPVTSREFGGFLLSFLIGASAIAFSLPLGIALALGRTSKLPFLRGVSTTFIEFIRGVPLITLLFIASTLLNIFLPPGSNFDIVMRVVIMVTLFASAYIAEIIRGALSAVPTGQTEGAASLGLNYWQTQRLIILPQALKISIPGIVSTFIAVFKDTTLVSIIGLLDPLGLANNIRADSAWTGIVWEIYGFAALIFFIFCFAMSQYSMWLERQLKTDHH